MRSARSSSASRKRRQTKKPGVFLPRLREPHEVGDLYDLKREIAAGLRRPQGQKSLFGPLCFIGPGITEQNLGFAATSSALIDQGLSSPHGRIPSGRAFFTEVKVSGPDYDGSADVKIARQHKQELLSRSDSRVVLDIGAHDGLTAFEIFQATVFPPGYVAVDNSYEALVRNRENRGNVPQIKHAGDLYADFKIPVFWSLDPAHRGQSNRFFRSIKEKGDPIDCLYVGRTEGNLSAEENMALLLNFKNSTPPGSTLIIGADFRQGYVIHEQEYDARNMGPLCLAALHRGLREIGIKPPDKGKIVYHPVIEAGMEMGHPITIPSMQFMAREDLVLDEMTSGRRLKDEHMLRFAAGETFRFVDARKRRLAVYQAFCAATGVTLERCLPLTFPAVDGNYPHHIDDQVWLIIRNPWPENTLR
jgi:hypothetical protein